MCCLRCAQLDLVMWLLGQDLTRELFSNPHSGHAAWRGDASSTAVDAEARALTLEMCNASPEHYECIFVSGATGGVSTLCMHLGFPYHI